LRLRKRYYEETGSNLNTKSTEKSHFFISYKRGGNPFDHLTFIHFWRTTEFLLMFRDTTFRGRLGSTTPTNPGQ